MENPQFPQNMNYIHGRISTAMLVCGGAYAKDLFPRKMDLTLSATNWCPTTQTVFFFCQQFQSLGVLYRVNILYIYICIYSLIFYFLFYIEIPYKQFIYKLLMSLQIWYQDSFSQCVWLTKQDGLGQTHPETHKLQCAGFTHIPILQSLSNAWNRQMLMMYDRNT